MAAWSVCTAAAVALAAPGTGDAPRLAGTLQPDQVLVVVNAKAEGSGTLGKYYCLARGIAPQRMLTLQTTTAYAVSRSEYTNAIRDVIRKHLRENDPEDQVRCIVLMWGVPVRVLPQELTPTERQVHDAYDTLSQGAAGRLAGSIELLKTVGVSFPQPRTNGLTPLTDLFEGTVRVNEPGKSLNTLLAEFAEQCKAKDALVQRLTDPARRAIAQRQLHALRLDTYGLAPFLARLPKEPASGPPDRAELQGRLGKSLEELKQLASEEETADSARRIVTLVQETYGVEGAYKKCRSRVGALERDDEDATVDSELALLWEGDGALARTRDNPMYWRVATASSRPAGVPARAIMTARIDGPTPRDALHIIKDSLETEKVGLKGTFYIDAGGKVPVYDEELKNLAAVVRSTTSIRVVLDTAPSVLAPGSAPDAALYVGWYSLRKYVPAFRWARGAVGWHVASFEAEQLRDPASNEWCVKMIQNGVVATIGAVNEPYLNAFPMPKDFFGLLLTGKFTVAECYWRTVPHASWRLTLIADPLYNPFAVRSQVKLEQLPPGLPGHPETATQKTEP